MMMFALLLLIPRSDGVGAISFSLIFFQLVCHFGIYTFRHSLFLIFSSCSYVWAVFTKTWIGHSSLSPLEQLQRLGDSTFVQ